jgi:aminopeptidase N
MLHKSFDIKNPNRVGALFGSFVANPFGFHAEDGNGYRFISDMIVRVDKINPQASARLAKSFLRWKDFNPKRRKLMKEVLEKLSKKPKLSVNVREIVAKALL